MDIVEDSLFNSVMRSVQNDVFANLGMAPNSIIRCAVQPLLRKPVQRVCELAFNFDDSAREHGFAKAARELVELFFQGHLIAWQFIDGQATRPLIPTKGPILIVANHPGTLDVLTVAACLPRDDVRIIARGYHILRSLPTVRQHLIYSERDTPTRMAVARAALRHLQQNGVLIYCPNGRLDPDPAYLPGACEVLSGWSPSVGLLMSKVPETKLIIAVLSGYLSPYALRHPLVRLGREPYQRLIIAEVLQVLAMLNSPDKMKAPLITFSEPLSMEELIHSAEPTRADGEPLQDKSVDKTIQGEIMQEVRSVAARQLEMHLAMRQSWA